MEKPEDVRLIDRDECHSGEHTVFIMPPEEPQEADGSECAAHYRCVSISHIPSLETLSTSQLTSLRPAGCWLTSITIVILSNVVLVNINQLLF